MELSILTPCLNNAQFLPDALASVTSRGGEVEHIVADGGSTDSTVEILRSWQSPQHRWFSGPDQGQSDALNKAFNHATGDIIGWLNADEWYLPGTLDVVRRAFAVAPEVDVLYGEFFMVDRNGLFMRSVPSHPFSIRALKLYGCFVPSCATFIRRRVLDGSPWDTDLRWIMDWDLWLRLSTSGARFKHLRTPLAAFRIHPDQVTAGNRDERAHEWADVHDRYGIPRNARAGVRRHLGRSLHAAMKAIDGGYYRQLRDRRRLAGVTLARPSSAVN